jgi:hypothetical protein
VVADKLALPARGFFMGVLPMPAAGQPFDEAYREAARCAELVPVWGRPSPFFALAADLRGNWGRTFVEKLIRGNGMAPIIHLSFLDRGLTLKTPPGMSDATLSSPAWRQAYKQAALDALRAARPLYLSVGNEVNRWLEKHGADPANANGFQHFVSLYEDIYDAAKALSPRTRVFCTFAREVVSENREANIEKALRMFRPEKLDLLVLTSYPFAVRGQHQVPKVPDDYYLRAARCLPGKRLGFSELGWNALPPLGGEPGQAEFITQLAGRLTRAQGIELEFLCWVWLHDLNENDHNGLIRRDGSPKPAYAAWKKLSRPGGQ